MADLKEEIIIGESLTRLVDSKIVNGVSTPLIQKRTINTSDFISNMSSRMNYGVGKLLPQNCRLVKPINSRSSILILEDKPKLRSVSFKYDFRREQELIRITGQEGLNAMRFLEGQSEPYRLKLSFPYIVYIMLIQEYDDYFQNIVFNVFFRKHSISRMNDYLNIANIFNLSDENSLCFGRSGSYTKDENPTLSDFVNRLISDFWNRPFSNEYQTRHYKYQNHDRLHSFTVWAHYSEIDPMFIYSTDWIIHNRNLDDEVKYISRLVSSSNSSSFKNTFIKSIVANNVDEENSALKYPYDNIVLGNQVLSLGDMLKYNENDLYVDSLIGNRNGATHIVFVNDSGQLSEKIEITESLKDDWESQIENQLNNYVNEVQFGNKTARVGDIIKIIPNNTYEIILKIRKSRDNQYEFILGKRFYMATENVFEVVDKFEINGLEIKPGTEYLVCNNQHQVAFKGKLIRIENNNYGVLYFFFKDVETNEERGISVDSLEDMDTVLVPVDDISISKPDAFRYLNQLYHNNNHNFMIIKDRGIYSKYNDTSAEFNGIYNRIKVLEKILSDDKQKLTIPSFDMDIEFSVGDDVIVADWDNPDQMFNIRKITAFEVDGDYLRFKLSNQSDDSIYANYIDLTSGNINVGFIRKVKSEFDGINIGTRVKLISDDLFNLPKRSSYQIAAFVMDGPRPMILFRDGSTIWYNDLKDNFEVITSESPNYRRMRPKKFDMTKIKWQLGDLCKKDDNMFLVNDGNEFMGIIYMKIDPSFIISGSLRARAEVSREYNSDFKRSGLITPRYHKNNRKILFESIPNFHNGCTQVSFDGYYPYLMPKTQEVSE